MSVQLTSEVTWLPRCVKTGEYHLHLSNYLLSTVDGPNVLVGGGPDQFHPALQETVDEMTGGEGIDAIILAHSMLPHTESVASLASDWDDVAVYAASGFPLVIGLPHAQPWQLTETITIGSRQISFLNPLLTDVVLSQWIYDHHEGVLFTAEGFGHYHRPDQCSALSSDLRGIPDEMVSAFYRQKLPHLTYADPAKLDAAIRTFFDHMDLAYLAPLHGNPVARADLAGYVESTTRTIEAIAERGVSYVDGR